MSVLQETSLWVVIIELSMCSVQHHLDLLQETLHLCVAMVDLFIVRKKVSLVKLQLLGITCILIASKYEERFSPSVS